MPDLPRTEPSDHFRHDVQGLRGVAVLAVTAVHAWPELLRGGFVGVDIFFVLSGYLISRLVFQDLLQGCFSLRNFYARRVRRLLPALCTVLLTCLLTAVLLTFPNEAQQIGRHVAAGATFSSNIALWMEAGYFDASSESKPLLHLWSLGIEEQFYILWPLLALLLLRWRAQGAWLLLGLLLLSFSLNVWWVVDKAKGTFFLLPTRAWELLMGAALAHAAVFGRGPLHRLVRAAEHPRTRNAMAWAGVTCIGAALALLDKHRHFPGWWALLPTSGTVLLLAAGPGAWFNRQVLSHRVLVFYGSISYPLYLWHWPLLVFPLLLGVDLDTGTRVLVLTASVALAALTLEFIERPVQRGAWGHRTVPALCSLLAAVGLGGAALQASDGLIATYPRSVQVLARSEFGFDYGAYRASRCFLDLEQSASHFAAECAGPSTAAGGLLLWGDSHAASLYPGLQQAVGAQRLAQYTKARCPPLLQPPPGSSKGCAQVNDHVLQHITAARPATVVLGGFWSMYGPAESVPLELLHTVKALQRLGVAQVVVMGHLPTWTTPVPRLLLSDWRRWGEVPERTGRLLDPRAPVLDAALRDALHGSGAVFVSPMDLLCNAAGCLAAQTRQGVAYPLVHDESHLTEDGSVLLIERSPPRLFNPEAL